MENGALVQGNRAERTIDSEPAVKLFENKFIIARLSKKMISLARTRASLTL